MTVDDIDITRLERAIERLEAKLDAYSDKYISKSEYEARQVITQAEIAKLSLEVTALSKQTQSADTAKWKLIACTLLGAITSGGILGIIDLVRTATGH